MESLSRPSLRKLPFLEQELRKLSALGERRHVISAVLGDAKSFLTASAPVLVRQKDTLRL